jgi:hypothetical protein
VRDVFLYGEEGLAVAQGLFDGDEGEQEGVLGFGGSVVGFLLLEH